MPPGVARVAGGPNRTSPFDYLTELERIRERSTLDSRSALLTA